MSREELQLIIRSLDEGICIKKFRRSGEGSGEDTQYFTNAFFEGVFKFALEKAPDGTFKDNSKIIGNCMKSKVFQLDQDQNHQLLEGEVVGQKRNILKKGGIYSANQLAQIDFQYLKNCVWLIVPEHRPVVKSTLGSMTSLQNLIDEEKYVQIKTAEYNYGEYQCHIFQFACVTCSIHFERAVTQSMCAKLMTQTVSHELRNPLNSIIMQ